jgi:predicted AAA+ superfamily ATPase
MDNLLTRRKLLDYLVLLIDESPAVALLGARQVGKTTLADQLVVHRQAKTQVHRFDLETAADRQALSQPETALLGLEGLVVIDEVQRQPDLFTILRPLLDRRPLPARYLLLGSASPELVRGVSESLAGRIQFLEMGGLNLEETSSVAPDRLWLRGGFPRAVLAPTDEASRRWREGFIATFLERDLPQLGIRVPAESLRRFWSMIAHYHGQIWNAADPARSLGVSEKTARHYLDILSGAYVVRVLPPWFENLGKRQTKAPKTYLRDSGLLHTLLGIETIQQLRSHPKCGASWEGFAIEQILSAPRSAAGSAFYWATHGGAELDLLLMARGKRIGFEFKYADAPAMTRSLHIALADLKLDQAYVVYPGQKRYPLHDRVEVVPLPSAMELADRF